jgi:hypothetical protein
MECPECFIRTHTENLLWIPTFETVEEHRVALLEFKETYNATGLIGRHDYKTPPRVRQEQQVALAKRAA